MEKHERRFCDLAPTEQTQLRTIKTINDLAEVTFLRTWIENDGFPCVALSINGVELTLPYLDTDFAANLMNPNDENVKTALVRNLRILSSECVDLNDEDEFEAEEEEEDIHDSYDSGDWGGNY